LLTITTEEFDLVGEVFALRQDLPATTYFVANALDAIETIGFRFRRCPVTAGTEQKICSSG
jgi:hypothetical protein